MGGMTYTTAIILNAVFAVLVVAGLTRSVWFGVSSNHEAPSVSATAQDERVTEHLAA
jgi:hypothetical protein